MLKYLGERMKPPLSVFISAMCNVTKALVLIIITIPFFIFLEVFMKFTRKLTLTALCIALCVVLPLAFHAIPDGGSIFLPMHIPVLLCGLMLGWRCGLTCGVLGVLLSSLITGMPPMAYVPPMLVELAVYGLVTGLLSRLVRTGKPMADIYISLISAMLIGRIAAGVSKALIFAVNEITMQAWFVSSFVTALPGLIIQLVLIPIIFFAVTRAELIPPRYGSNGEAIYE